MAENTVTVVLDGVVSLDDFQHSIAHLTGMIGELDKEIAPNSGIQWVIDDLESGSATVTVRAEAAPQHICQRSILAIRDIGRALQEGAPIPRSAAVVAHARALTSIINGRVTSVGIETDTAGQVQHATIASQYSSADGPRVKYSFGRLKGTILTLKRRRGVAFTLYDSVFDRGVRCYVNQDQEDKVRALWGERVTVSGRIGRDPLQGRPVEVRDVTEIERLPDQKPGSLLGARGLFTSGAGADKPEEIIRRAWNGSSD